MHPSITIGASEVAVYPIGLGGMPLSLAERPPQNQAISVVRAFIEGGGQFIDTANVYCIDDNDIGHNERLIRQALTLFPQRHDIVVATKGGLRRPKGRWDVDGHPDFLRQSCEASLRDLGVESIFLYQLHAPDPAVPLADSVGALLRLREQGKIHHIGLSNVSPRDIDTALAVAPILSVQNRCNLFERKSFSSGVVEKCRLHNICFIPHSPVGGHYGHHQAAISPGLNRIARKHSVSPYRIMLAWLLQQGPHILPIPGASKITSIVDSLKAVDIQLETGDMDELNQLAK